MTKAITTFYQKLTTNEIKQIAKLLIKKARNHLSQAQINMKFGYNSNYCARWERGDIKIEFDNFLKIIKWGKCIDWKDITSKTYLINPYILIDDLYKQISERHGPNSSKAQKYYRLKSRRNALTLNDVIEILDLKFFLPGMLLLFWKENNERPDLVEKIISLQASLISRTKVFPFINVVRDFISLPVYINQAKHSDQWIADQLKIPVKYISLYLKTLAESGEIEWIKNKYSYRKRYTFVDARKTQERWNSAEKWFKFLETYAHSARVHPESIDESLKSHLGFTLSPVSRETFEKIINIQQEYRLKLNNLITEDKGSPENFVFYIEVVADYLHLLKITELVAPDFLVNTFKFPNLD